MHELLLIRHAPVEPSGHLVGHTDFPARFPRQRPAPPFETLLRDCHVKITSPALRCRQTAQWVCSAPPHEWRTEPLLQEQDFGEWDGRPYADIPDLGVLSRTALADHRPPEGESFADLAARVQRALPALLGPKTMVVAHAGVIRAVLGLALGRAEDGLAFAIDPLSLTRLSHHDGTWAILQVNVPLCEKGA